MTCSIFCVLSAGSKQAFASDGCRYTTPTTVTCTKPAFELLMDGLVTCRADKEICDLRLRTANDELKLCEARVAELLAIDHCAACQKKLSPLKPVGGYAAGLLGVAAVAASLAFPMPDAAKWSVGLAGVAAMSVGVVFVLP